MGGRARARQAVPPVSVSEPTGMGSWRIAYGASVVIPLRIRNRDNPSMKQYNLFDLVSSLKQSVLSYVCYSLPLGNHTSQSLLGEEFFRRLESDNFRGPFFEAVPSYKKAQSLRELFEPVVSKEPCARKF